ncbi:LAME_0G07954g1_1 [Lachancea meyersii CBS 8951]|uniref:LAME_0G07954g1_1 n=1 Tax=Lachancea meyersii CBS 8951 TaxID=1266667 RepID=A0A1G4K827_9SACH|nr:LAME_0G07954g1_1 [Lachancea meyersii CBS 8951]
MNENSIDSQLRGSPSKNVFKRLSTSPIKKIPMNTNKKNAMRLSPERPLRNWEQTTGYHATPKRLQSPPHLKEFKSPAGTVSVDRVHFKNDPKDKSIQLSFPTSPVRTTYSNFAAPGGDGSLSRIRTRFGGGQRSPHKTPNAILNALPRSVTSARNLLPELQEQDETNRTSSINNHSVIIQKSAMPKDSVSDGFRIKKPRNFNRKKSVKFETDLDASNDVQEQLSRITAMLTQLMERQDRLEAKLSSIDRG